MYNKKTKQLQLKEDIQINDFFNKKIKNSFYSYFDQSDDWLYSYQSKSEYLNPYFFHIESF